MTYIINVRKTSDGLFDISRDRQLINEAVRNEDLEDYLRSHGIFEDLLHDMLRRLKQTGEATEEMPADTWRQVDVVIV